MSNIDLSGKSRTGHWCQEKDCSHLKVSITLVFDCPNCNLDHLVQISKENKFIHGFVNVVTFKCSNCRSNYLIENDLQIKVIDAPFQCISCGDAFSSRIIYENHKLIHLPSTKIRKCSYCNDRFTDTFKFKTHMHNHTNKFEYTCANCKMGFNDRESLDVHKTQVHEVKQNL